MKKIYSHLKSQSKLIAILFAVTLLSQNSFASFSYKSTRVPSVSADTSGIFVRISVPQYKRYSCGAPVVIYVCGGFGSTGMLGNMFNLSNYGFIVVEFNFPGGGSGTQKSGGVFDNRGSNSMIAIKDVIRYTLGQTTDKNGKYLHQITGTKNPIYSNVGIIGGSNGGCNLLAALGLYSEYFNSLAWVSFFESPIGDGMLTADPGKPYGHAVSIFKNNSYNDSTGVFNWDAFKFAPDSVAYKQGNTVIKGLFYFDVNNNGVFNRGIDYDVIGKYNSPYSQKYFYSQQIVQHAYSKGYYPLPTTSNYFADSTQTKNYWNLRNGDNFISTFMPNMPNLKVLFMVRDDSDHITSAPNHPEVLNTWNKFSTAGCNWFRVNSDKSYIEYVTGLTLPTAPDNDANILLDNLNIRSMVMPGNIFSDRYMNHYASTLEMADRVMNNNWSPNLSGILSVTCPAASKEEEEELTLENQPTLYPNPSSGETYIQVNASEYGKSTVRVFDAIGREVLQPQTETVLKGFNLLILDTNNLSAGNYFVRIDAPGVTHTLQFTRE